MDRLLEGKVAIVTGGASGLGRATVELFAQHGANIVVADVNDVRGAETVRAVEAASGHAVFVHTDVGSSQDMQAAVEFAEGTFGRVDAMVANAGIAGAMKRLEEIDDDEMQNAFQVNFFGVWRAFKYAIPALRRAGGGSMTATGSLAGAHTLGGIKRGAYTSTKAAVNAFTSYVASEVAADKIRVNCVCPGGMRTNIVESYGLSSEKLQTVQAAFPKGRLLGAFGDVLFPVCDPSEVASVHLFLHSKLASFVSGQVIVADAAGYITTVASAIPSAVAMEP
jgi:NAD(P)-dependent dehydrogenase (short-subunit alcohol dehydrogenase family)